MLIKDQLVLVTAGAHGPGEHITRAFLSQGAKVVINYNNSIQAAHSLVEEYPEHALALQADVTDAVAVQTLFAEAKAHFGQAITTVINNALPSFSFSGDARQHASEISFSPWGSGKAALNTTQAALPDMRKAGFGRIINVGTNLFKKSPWCLIMTIRQLKQPCYRLLEPCPRT